MAGVDLVAGTPHPPLVDSGRGEPGRSLRQQPDLRTRITPTGLGGSHMGGARGRFGRDHRRQAGALSAKPAAKPLLLDGLSALAEVRQP